MAIELDHVIVSARDQLAAARQLAGILGVPWSEHRSGPFSPVYVNAGLTVDFINDDSRFPIQHLCFRVSDREFDEIFGRFREAGIPYRSHPHGPPDMRVNTQFGGRMVYWSEPDGHTWEILTVSYARRS
ncbi:MAG: VOC family protein [Alphaproteobacteria bacterium]|nr:VOC family protein [Alphaproteobacteria bacterium]